MANPALLILVVAGAAAVAASRKKSATEPGGTQPGGTGPGDVDASGIGASAVPMPPGGITPLNTRYRRLVRDCIKKLDDPSVDDVKLCVLRKLWPDVPWPPPPNAHQWQRNAWFHRGMDTYIRHQIYVPVS